MLSDVLRVLDAEFRAGFAQNCDMPTVGEGWGGNGSGEHCTVRAPPLPQNHGGFCTLPRHTVTCGEAPGARSISWSLVTYSTTSEVARRESQSPGSITLAVVMRFGEQPGQQGLIFSHVSATEVPTASVS